MQSELIYGVYLLFLLVGVAIGLTIGGLLGYQLRLLEEDEVLEDDDYSVLDQEELA